MGFVTERPFEEVVSENSPNSSENCQDAQGRWTYCTHEGEPRASGHHRHEGGFQGPMREAPVGLPEGAQPPRPREQAVLHARQEDGQGLRHRAYACLRDVEVLGQPSGEDRGGFHLNTHPLHSQNVQFDYTNSSSYFSTYPMNTSTYF